MDFKSNILLERAFQLSHLEAVGQELALLLSSYSNFCVWMSGPLGAGKTTLVGAILRGFGLNSNIPVLSPTYTVMGDYEIHGAWYGHLDLYRLGPQSSLEDLGLIDAHPYKGIFVEWPERAHQDPSIKPTHFVTLDFGENDYRSFTLRQAMEE